MAKAKRSAKAATAAVSWRKDRITASTDPETGRRIVDLPTLKGMTASVRDEIFAFEAEHLGTVRAVIRMNKRAIGAEVPTPAKLTAAGIPASLKARYA